MVKRETIQMFMIIGISILLLIGVSAFGEILYGQSTEQFRPTQATVINNEIDVIEDDEGLDEYVPVITYKYTVDGVQYTNDDLSAADNKYSSQHSAEAVLDRYPVGSNITIYYNPQNPQTSVIKQGVQDDSISELKFSGIFSSVLLLIFIVMSVPDVINYYKKRQVLQQVKSGKNSMFSKNELSIPGNKNPNDQLEHFTPSLELQSPSQERLNQLKDDFNATIGNYLILLAISMHQLAIFTVIGGTGALISYGFQNITGLYSFLFVFVGINWIIVLIGAVYLFRKMYNPKSSIASKIVRIVLFPIAYFLASLFLMLIFFVLPAMVGLWLAVSGAIYAIPYFFTTYVLQINLSLGAKLGIFGISSLLAILVLAYIDYSLTQIDLQYGNLSEGNQHFDHVFSNGKIELYSMHYQDKLMVGSKTGDLIIIDEHNKLPNIRVKLHNGAIIEILSKKNTIFTISNDKQIQMSKLTQTGHQKVSSHLFEVIPRAMVMNDLHLFIGLDNGKLVKLRHDMEKLELIEEYQVTSSRITALAISDNILFIGTSDLHLMDSESLSPITDIKLEGGAITDIDISSENIYTSSLEGNIVKIPKTNFQEPKQLHLPDAIIPNEGISSLMIHQNILLVGWTGGELYRIDLDSYQPNRWLENDVYNISEVPGMDKFEIHLLWVEDMLIRDQHLYTVSSDGTLKTLHLFEDLRIAIKEKEINEGIAENKIISSKEPKCLICGGRTGKLIACNSCEANYHNKHFSKDVTTSNCPKCYSQINSHNNPQTG